MAPDADFSEPFLVIVGFGPVGRAVADRCQRSGARCRIIELNPQTVRRQIECSRDVVCGDGTDPGVLRAAGVERADAVVLTIPNDQAMVLACRAVRAVAPGVFLAVRVTHLSQGMLARAEGADEVVVEEIVAAESMANLLQQQFARADGQARGRAEGGMADGDVSRPAT